MKRKLLQFFVLVTFITSVKAQDLGKIIIRNAQANYPTFIVSLNGIRLTNDYNSSVSFDYLDDRIYRVKLLQSGSSNVLNFTVNNAPNYISKYILNKDNYGNYSLILESKALIGSENPVTSPEVTLSVIPPTATVTTPMAESDYADMLKSVKKESMESTKLEMAKTFFGNQNLSSAQVLGILKVFSMESTKLNFSKFAYSRVLDKQNYYKAYDAFNMGSSKKEMSEYIKSNP